MLNLDGHKLMHHLDRLREWKWYQEFKMTQFIAPITVDIALTRACTFNCVYCYSKLQENECKPMTWPVIKRFLEDCRDIGVKAVSLVSDGESTCSPHFVNTIQYGHAIGLDMAVGTNGLLLNEEILGQILPCLTYIRFNVSAGTSDSYCKYHGVGLKEYDTVMHNIRLAVKLKRHFTLPVTVGLQMVFLPPMIDDVVQLVQIGKLIGVDYTVIKHCSDDENGSLNADYKVTEQIRNVFRTAESYNTVSYQVAVKWSKILTRQRSYSRCYGAQLIPQISGSGLFAPCGMLFNDKYKKYHIGNIVDTSFKELFYSDRYKNVMMELASERFDAQTMCGSLCLQHKCNEFLNDILRKPEHVNFI